jgi:hypothetical protein
MSIKKLIVVINLLIVSVVFTILSFKKENLITMFYHVFIVRCRKRCRIIWGMFTKELIDVVKNSKRVL